MHWPLLALTMTLVLVLVLVSGLTLALALALVPLDGLPPAPLGLRAKTHHVFQMPSPWTPRTC